VSDTPEPDLERRFTLEEANAMLPDLRRTLPALQSARQIVLRAGERIKGTAPKDGGGSEGREYWDALALLRKETERLSSEGIILRDIDSGLVDFPAEREGRPMFLCWRLDEPAIEYWHPVDTGFSGRRPLSGS
jgi:hypothetical protein